MPDELVHYLTHPLHSPDFRRHSQQVKPPRDGPYGSPHMCYHIHVDFISTLLILCDYYTYTDLFTGTPLERQEAAERWEDLKILLMTGNLECGGTIDMRLRQDPNDDCILQVSYDGGTSWSTAFNYELCFMKTQTVFDTDVEIYITNQEQTMNVNINLYDGTAASVAPDMEYDTTPDDDLRDKAKCAALVAFVNVAGASSAALLNHSERLLYDISLQISYIRRELIRVAGGIGAMVGVIPGPVDELLWIFAFQLNQAHIEYLEGILSTEDNWDAEVQADVVCHAMQTIEGDTMQFAEFRSMFTDVSDVEGISAEDETYLFWLAQDTSLFIKFIDWSNAAFLALENGDMDYDCPCDEWMIEITNFDAIPNVSTTDFVGGAGFFGSGNRLEGDDIGAGDNIRFDFLFTMPASFDITKMRVQYTAINLSTTDSLIAAQHSNIQHFYVQIPAEGADKDINDETRSPGSTFGIQLDTGLTGVVCFVDSLTLWGTGDNPFV